MKKLFNRILFPPQKPLEQLKKETIEAARREIADAEREIHQATLALEQATVAREFYIQRIERLAK